MTNQFTLSLRLRAFAVAFKKSAALAHNSEGPKHSSHFSISLLRVAATDSARQPHLVIMDEPTNHLDLPSIECLEAALENCPCGLLLVSHDEQLMRRVTRIRWHIAADPGGPQGHTMLKIM